MKPGKIEACKSGTNWILQDVCKNWNGGKGWRIANHQKPKLYSQKLRLHCICWYSVGGYGNHQKRKL